MPAPLTHCDSTSRGPNVKNSVQRTLLGGTRLSGFVNLHHRLDLLAPPSGTKLVGCHHSTPSVASSCGGKTNTINRKKTQDGVDPTLSQLSGSQAGSVMRRNDQDVRRNDRFIGASNQKTLWAAVTIHPCMPRPGSYHHMGGDKNTRTLTLKVDGLT